MKGEIAQLIKTATSEETDQDKESSTPSSMSETMYEAEEPDYEDENDEAQEGGDQLAPIKPNGGGPLRKGSNLTLRRASTASFRGPRGKLSDEEDNKVGSASKRRPAFS